MLSSGLLGLGGLEPMALELQPMAGLGPGSLAGLVKQEPGLAGGPAFDQFFSPRAMADFSLQHAGFLSACGINPVTPTSVAFADGLLSGMPSLPTTPFAGPGGSVFHPGACLPFPTSAEVAAARAQAFLARAALLQER